MSKSQLKLLIFTSAISIISACSHKTYEREGVKNLKISYKENTSFFESAELEVFVFELGRDCKSELLGRVEVGSSTPVEIAIGPDKNIAFIPSVVKTSWFSKTDRLYNLGTFAFTPKKNENYLLNVEMDNNATGHNYYVVQGEKKKEIKNFWANPKCDYDLSFNRTW